MFLPVLLCAAALLIPSKLFPLPHPGPLESLRHFSSKEIPGREYMDPRTLRLLDRMRDADGTRMGWHFVVLHTTRSPIAGFSYHAQGLAIDGVMVDNLTREPLPLIRQYHIASRWPWTGIGLYPYWSTPGLHLDTRPCRALERRSRWFRDKAGEYRPIEEFLASHEKEK